MGWAVPALVIAWGAAVLGDDPPVAPDLERQVMPLFKARCIRCHGPAKHEGHLNLATPRGIARGGESGQAVLPGRPEESLLWERVDADEMPPKEPLSPEEKVVLLRWIEGGAPGLPCVEPDAAGDADHWAFAPLSRPTPPEVRDARRIRTPVDRFIQAALEARGLSLGPEADRATLLRRVSLDLTGLLPTPEQVEQFLDDPAPDAYERLVDRYLESPQYGVRWGKYWLDAAGYADSNGYFSADSDRPLAFRYRDYVVRSWNEDKPLDQFIREQLAGDELAGFRPGDRATPGVMDLLAATHFLRNAPDGTGESDGNPDEVRADKYAVLEGANQIIGSALLGLTVQCARCHDHKFEPVTQEDYYRLYAVLWPAFDLEHWVKPQDRIVEAPLPGECEAWAARSRQVDEEATDATIRHVLADPFVDPSGERGKALTAELAAIRKKLGDRPGRIAWLSDLSPSPSSTYLLKRGLYGDPGPEVAPGPPAVLTDPDNPFEPAPPGTATTGRRLAFARWMTRPGSRAVALLARVTANRLWQHHFGTGLVASPENLGYSGAPPSHPELLEWLATELADRGWRAKRWHRLILTSSAYRQVSAPREGAPRVDPENRWLWCYPVRRLDAEAVRDAMLAASGELDGSLGGPYVPTKVTEEGEVVVDEADGGALRRSLYLQQRRTQVPSLLDAFDAPSIVTTCTRRSNSTTPLQSLSLLNSGFVAARARALARRAAEQVGTDLDCRVRFAFLAAIGREPGADELSAARAFLQSQPELYPGRPDAEERAWSDLCQMILASNAFLFIE
jgi:hypothetical protein